MRAIVCVALLLLAGCGGPAAPSVMTQEAFCKLARGANLDTVRAKMGPPDHIEPSERSWTWKDRIRDEKTGKLTAASIQYDEAGVRVWYVPGCGN